jgi:hypothetical protein
MLVADEESGEKIDAIKQQEEKLDGYILKFINLNADNKYVINGALDNLEARLTDFHQKMKTQMDQNLVEMNSLAKMEQQKDDRQKGEVSQHVSVIHNTFIDQECKRMDD